MSVAAPTAPYTPVFTLALQQTLHCTEGGSDKLYRVIVRQETNGTASVVAKSCRRGGAWVDQGTKAEGVPLAVAMKKAEALVKSKTAKGYRITETLPSGAGGATPLPPSAPLANEKQDSGFRPQLLNAIEEKEALALLDSSKYLMQQKHDGRRLTLRRTPEDGTVGINKLGQIVTPSAHLIEAAKIVFAGDMSFVMDGELVGETFYAFDLLAVGMADMAVHPYQDRLALLTRVLAPHQATGPFKAVETWERADLKRAAYERLLEEEAEGVVFKLKKAPYAAGRPNSGGPQLKAKFYATASFVSLGLKPGKRSVRLGLLDDKGNIQEMGFCTIPPNHELPAEGAIVEVRYLYALPNGGKVYQPTYLGQRDDIRREECLVAQLKFKPEGDSDGFDE